MGADRSRPPPRPSPTRGEGARPRAGTSLLPSPSWGGAGGGGGGSTRRLRLFGPLSWLGLVMGLFVFAVDQLYKWWMLGPFDIAARQPVRVLPFLDLILTWNRGISYGLFNHPSEFGRWALLTLTLIVTWGLWLWLARMRRPFGAAALGLVIGGALGNAVDRLVHGAVADFFLFHAYGFSWYVFNIADAAIVTGVALLIYELVADRKRPAY